MDKQQKLADVLRSKRYERKLTQEKAAELLDISTRWYQDIEAGKGEPGFKKVCKLAKEFKLDFAQFDEEII
jgi:transcriptional regulator with XRE-family HTH domain